MPWDLDTARAVAGYQPNDNTHDSALQRVMDIVIATVENLLKRPIQFRREKAEFFHVNDRRLYLPRYPVHRLFSPPEAVIIHNRNGWVEPKPGHCWQLDELSRVVIDYEGGYNPLPSDLEDALWSAFSYRWSMSDPLTGFPVAGAGTTTTQGGEITRVTINDFGSVSFSTSQTKQSASLSAGGIDPEYWGWLAPWASILSMYSAPRDIAIVFTS